jgi:glycosyltransferase involved in cell wall biosynthesis
MISIIIPTYNRMDTTHRAVASILSQEVDAEIIIVDDASSPPYQLEEDKRNNPEIKIIRKDINKGPSAARNSGIKAATHPLISFLDSDDFLIETSLRQRMEFAIEAGILTDKGAHKIVGCSWQETDMSGEVVNIRYPKSSRSSDDLFSGCWFCPGSAVIMNRSWFMDNQMAFDENLKRLEDLDLFMRLGAIGASYVAHSLLGVSITASDSRYPDVIITACEAMKSKHLGNDSPLSPAQNARLKAYLFYELSRAHISKSEYHRALDYLVKSFIQRPRLSMYPGLGWTKSPR